MDIVFLVFLGVVGGIIAGMLGLGGGIFYILLFPYIINALGFPPELNAQYVISNSLFGIMVASGMSIIAYKKKGEFPWKEILFVGLSAALVAYLSMNFIVLQPWFSKTIFNAFVIVLMLFILVKMYLELHLDKKENGQIKASQGILSGSISGFVSACSGLGGGVIIIPILTMRYKISLQKAKIISLAVIFISSLSMTINNLIAQPEFIHPSIKTIGYIIPSTILPISLGVLLGSPLGVRWSIHLNRKILDVLFMIFVFLVLIEKSLSLLNAIF